MHPLQQIICYLQLQRIGRSVRPILMISALILFSPGLLSSQGLDSEVTGAASDADLIVCEFTTKFIKKGDHRTLETGWNHKLDAFFQAPPDARIRVVRYWFGFIPISEQNQTLDGEVWKKLNLGGFKDIIAWAQMQIKVPNDTYVSYYVCPNGLVEMTPKISYSGYPLQQQTESVILYEDTTYQGASQTLKIGQYDVHQLSLGNDQLSSILVPQGMRVRLFEHAGFQGTFREITADTPDLGAQWNDRVSSLWVYSEAYTNVCVSTNTAPACGYEPEWQIFDDFNEPLSDSQWTQSISGTAIINAGAGILALDASAATGPYTYPRYAVVNSTQEFTSGAFRFVGIQEEVDRLWFVGLDNGQGTYILVRRDHPENRNLEFAVYSNDEMIDLIFFDPPIQPPIIEEITILWSDYSVDVVVKVDGQTQYTHHVDLPGILAPMPISTGAYTSTRLIIDDIFISEYALEER